MLKMPFLTMEEHHEAFYYWGLAVEKGWIPPQGNVLFHVDHHDDLTCGGYFHDFSKSFLTLEERRVFTYSALGIADFIVPALYEGLFSQMFNMKGLVKQPFSTEEKQTRTRIEHFFNWLGSQPWEPALVTICRSAHSGYLPREQAELVEELVCEGLKRLWA